MEVTFSIEDPLSGEARALVAALDAELRTRYPVESIHGADLAALRRPPAAFVMARMGPHVVGCGALRPLDEQVVEVKRMYVPPEWRGRGIARALLHTLERLARERGFAAIRLEAGAQQPEALALYTSAGYAPIPCFGEYEHDPLSLCMEKRVEGGGPSAEGGHTGPPVRGRGSAIDDERG